MPDQPLILRTIAGQPCERVPVWFMRQAGRYLPEYRQIRQKHRMLDVIRTPELAFEVTMQPIRRFDLDAAIIFADILNPLMALGIDLDFVEGEGPKIFNPITSQSDIDRLRTPDVEKDLSYTLKAIELCVAELAARNIPVFGFAGAPFTLSAYLIEGGKLGDLYKTKQLMFSEPESWHRLQNKIIELLVPYCLAQLNSGVSVVQLFDSWAGYLGPSQYKHFVLPYLHELIGQIRARSSAPLMYFSTGTAGILPLVSELKVRGFSIDWRTPISYARRVFGDQCALQGNLDPLILAGEPEYLNRQVKEILREGMQAGKYIFNLGHGIIPQTPPENVAKVIATVREFGKY